MVAQRPEHNDTDFNLKMVRMANFMLYVFSAIKKYGTRPSSAFSPLKEIRQYYHIFNVKCTFRHQFHDEMYLKNIPDKE